MDYLGLLFALHLDTGGVLFFITFLYICKYVILGGKLAPPAGPVVYRIVSVGLARLVSWLEIASTGIYLGRYESTYGNQYILLSRVEPEQRKKNKLDRKQL